MRGKIGPANAQNAQQQQPETDAQHSQGAQVDGEKRTPFNMLLGYH